MSNRQIGIFGGTFNPVHRGHIALAKELVATGIVNEVWLTLSPANPLKADRPGANDFQRCEMLEKACDGIEGVKPCFIEFALPRPSYTLATLRALSETHRDCSFRLIIGADNWLIFDRWHKPEEIIEQFGVIIYPRPGCPIAGPLPANVTYLPDLPELDISSTEIRNNLPESLNLVDPAVAEIIERNNLYATT